MTQTAARLASETPLAEVETAVPGMGHPLPVRLSRIKPDPDQPRKTFSQAGIDELAHHIQENGQKSPVKLRPDPKEKGSFILIGGERRWRAFCRIQEWTGKEPTVKAFFETVASKDTFREAFLDNLQREDLLPLETAEALHKLHDAGESKAGLARLIGKSSQYVDDYILLHSLPGEVKRLMDSKRPREQQLSITTAVDIARSTPDTELRIALARETLERRLGVSDARHLIEIRTGEAGWRVGGYQRDTNNDYKLFTSFLGGTQKKGEEFLKLDFESMYFNRDDEFGDREADATTIRSLIGVFQKFLKKVEEVKPLK